MAREAYGRNVDKSGETISAAMRLRQVTVELTGVFAELSRRARARGAIPDLALPSANNQSVSFTGIDDLRTARQPITYLSNSAEGRPIHSAEGERIANVIFQSTAYLGALSRLGDLKPKESQNYRDTLVKLESEYEFATRQLDVVRQRGDSAWREFQRAIQSLSTPPELGSVRLPKFLLDESILAAQVEKKMLEAPTAAGIARRSRLLLCAFAGLSLAILVAITYQSLPRVRLFLSTTGKRAPSMAPNTPPSSHAAAEPRRA